MTREIPVIQGSPEWMRARLGIPTASMFHKIVRPVKGGLSKQASEYAYRLAWERLSNEPAESLEGVEWMERGKALEPVAAKHYEWDVEVETRAAGFFTTDDGTIGASPDRVIIGKPIGVEFKAPAPWTHLRYLLEGPGADYRCQVQGQLWVCELDFVDFYSYNERAPAARLRTGRDEPFIRQIRDALDGFNELLLSMLERAKSLGAFQAYAEAVTPLEVERAGELHTELLDAFGIPP